MKDAPPSEFGAGPPLSGGIPLYFPSTVISRTADFHAILRSPHQVDAVESFYAEALARGAWQVVSHASSLGRATLSARRDGLGTTISIYRNLDATGISISTYPV